MSFNVNLQVTVSSAVRTLACLASSLLTLLSLLFLCCYLYAARFPVVDRIARPVELTFMAGAGCLPALCVFVETHLTSMKFIIALLVQEVKRYVVTG